MLAFLVQIGEIQAQGVEKSINSIQLGVLGTWINNEYQLSNEISLKSELGLVAGFRGCSNCTTQYALIPTLELEPRWYYNISKRNSKNKTTKNNSANFVSFGIKYYPDWFAISNAENVHVANQISFIPKWGIKRTIANSNFNYELGIGIGKGYYLDADKWDTTADLLIRIGYTIKRK